MGVALLLPGVMQYTYAGEGSVMQCAYNSTTNA